MKVNADKHIDQFVEKVMKEVAIEKPSFDFTSKVMDQVIVIKKREITTYKPLISKYIWMIIFGGVIALVALILINGDSSATNNWIDKFDLSVFSNNIFSKVKLSKISFYAILLSTLMFYIQIPLIKNQLDKQFKV
jgi:hypothetical protein